MTIEDYQKVSDLWKSDQNLYLDERDTKENLKKYLLRNLEMSFVVEEDSEIIGTLLGGHDGRNAELHHLFVIPEKRGQGIAQQLIDSCLNSLKKQELQYINIFVKQDSKSAPLFWQHLGFKKKEAACYYLLLKSSEQTGRKY